MFVIVFLFIIVVLIVVVIAHLIVVISFGAVDADAAEDVVVVVVINVVVVVVVGAAAVIVFLSRSHLFHLKTSHPFYFAVHFLLPPRFCLRLPCLLLLPCPFYHLRLRHHRQWRE